MGLPAQFSWVKITLQLLLVSFLPANAQFFHPAGYVVMLGGDTLRGETAQPTSDRVCLLRASATASVRRIPADSARMYQAAAINFYSHPTQRDGEVEVQRRFLMLEYEDESVLVAQSLADFAGAEDDVFYAGLPGGVLRELATDRINPRKRYHRSVSPAGRALLLTLRSGCPTLQDRLTSPGYLEADSLGYYLAQCQWRARGETDPLYHRPIRFGLLGGGYAVSRFSQHPSDATRPGWLRGNGGGNALLTLCFDLRRNFRHQASLVLGAGIDEPRYSVRGGRQEATYEPSFWAFPGALRLRPFRGRIVRPYFDVGAISRFTGKAYRNESKTTRDGQPDEIAEVVPDKRRYTLAATAGAGVEWSLEGSGAAFVLGVRADTGGGAGSTFQPRQWGVLVHFGFEFPFIDLVKPSPAGSFYRR